MSYLFQSFTVGQVYTAAAANQTEVNVRDAIHGVAGVLDPQTLKPQTDNTYDLGTTALRWRNVYAGGFTAKVRNISEDFMGLVIPWTMPNSVPAGGVASISYTPQSHGLAILTVANASTDIAARLFPKAQPADWSQLASETWANVETMDPAVVIHMAGLINEANSDGMHWVLINSGFMRPRNRTGASITDGADVAVAVNTLQQFRVETTVNTATYYLNGALKQGLSTNITSSRVLGTAMMHSVTATQRTMYVDYLSFEVVP